MADLRIDIKIKGARSVIKRLQWTPKDVQRLQIPLIRAARRILDRSDQLVPVVTGNLLSTGKIRNRSTQFGFATEVSVEYGGPPGNDRFTPAPKILEEKGGGRQVLYAEEVHERSSSPNYLLRAFNPEAPTVEREVRDEIDKIYAEKRRLF